MVKSHSKQHELSFGDLVSIVTVLVVLQKSNYFHQNLDFKKRSLSARALLETWYWKYFWVNVESINSFALSPSNLLDKLHFLYVLLGPCLAASTLPFQVEFFQDVSLRWLDNCFQTVINNWVCSWYTLFSETTGRWSDVLLVPPPLWSCEMVPFVVVCCRLVSSFKISLTHIFKIWARPSSFF